MNWSSLAALPLEDLISQAAAGNDSGWRQQLQTLRDSQDFKPILPSTLQAELRDYQQVGFSWLARLAHWGVGGCLADDMGLGKTLQSLAIILRYRGGHRWSSLTSVSSKWQSKSPFTDPQHRNLTGNGPRPSGTRAFDFVITTYTCSGKWTCSAQYLGNHHLDRPGNQAPPPTLKGSDVAAGQVQTDHHRPP
jgi:hypothetical protein